VNQEKQVIQDLLEKLAKLAARESQEKLELRVPPECLELQVSQVRRELLVKQGTPVILAELAKAVLRERPDSQVKQEPQVKQRTLAQLEKRGSLEPLD